MFLLPSPNSKGVCCESTLGIPCLEGVETIAATMFSAIWETGIPCPLTNRGATGVAGAGTTATVPKSGAVTGVGDTCFDVLHTFFG